MTVPTSREILMPVPVGHRLWFSGALLACLGLAWIAHTANFSLDRVLALKGFSILEVLAAHSDPDAFARDYPGGARLTTALSPMVHVYKLSHDLLGLDGLVMMYALILAELCVLTAGAWLFWTTMLEISGRDAGEQDGPCGLDAVARLAFVWLMATLLLSTAQRANVVNFGFPVFHGQFYGYADGLRLAAIAMVLRRRWLWAAGFFVICFALHPIKTVVAAAFATGLLMADWRQLLRPSVMLAMAGTVACWAVWFLGTLRRDHEGVPLDAFIAYTRAMQSHWYPLDLGMLSYRHERGLSPFMAMVGMIWLALLQRGWACRIRTGMIVGLILLLILSMLGVLFSVQASSADLIRACIARASTLISLIGPPIILAGAVLAWRSGRMLLFVGFLAFLLAGFEYPGGVRALGPLFVLILAGLHVLHAPRDRVRVLVMALPVAAVMTWLWLAYPRASAPLEMAGRALMIGVGLWLALLMQAWFAPVKRRIGARVPAVFVAISLAFAAGAVHWTVQRVDRVDGKRDLAEAYLETQRWARASTPSGTLFMVDPCRWYGWRDFSHRASIGTVREWYMTAWIYTDRNDVLARGREIGRTLGLEMEPHQVTPQSARQMCQAARAAYYAPDLAGPTRVAQRFGVDYLVFEKAHTGPLPPAVTDRYAFENEHFAVLPASELNP